LNDGGWGSLVRRGRNETGQFGEELVTEAAELLLRYWDTLSEKPVWLTSVPSLKHPHLVQDFAVRLADRLKLPFVPCLQRVQDRPSQQEMRNSHMQLRNVLGAFAVTANVPAAPVLLVDDFVDSGWTLAYVGQVLRQAGSGTVYPFALAQLMG
jgi:ATP-dependent DNA helicase RecQ